LLVEDEPQVRAVAKGVLQHAGYRVLDAGDGPEACALCEREPGDIQLLLTDVEMPKMNGFELAQRIEHLRPGTRVLFMSGYTEAGSTELLARDGASMLQKPLTPQTLLHKVRGVLGVRRRG
jgi:CheY-like chemotaxis protein